MAMSRAGRKRLMLGAALLATVGLAAGVYAFRQAQLHRDMTRWLADGTEAHGRGDYRAALENLNEFVSRDKTNAEALLDFADARRHIPLENGVHMNQAVDITQTALQIEPDSPRARVMLMELYGELRRWPEARDAAERVLEIQPASLAAHRVRLEAFLSVGRADEIIAAAQRMAQALSNDLDAQRLAFSALLAADADADILEKFVAERQTRFPDRLGVRLMQIQLLLRNSDKLTEGSPEADALLKRLQDELTVAASMPAETSSEAETLIHVLDTFGPGLAALADQALERLMRDPETARDLAAFAASRAWANGDADDAGAIVLRSTPSLADADDDALGWLALSDRPEAEEARRLLAQRQSPTCAQWLTLAEVNRQLIAGEALRAAEALAGMTRFEDPAAESVAAYLTGVAHEALGESAQAAQVWKDLLEAEPTWRIARDKLAGAYLAMGRLEESRDVLFHSTDPASFGDLGLRVTVMLEERGVFDPNARSGADMADQALKRLPESLLVRVWAARAYLARGTPERSLPLVDALISQGIGDQAMAAVVLAARLEPIDPARAASLRAVIEAAASDPVEVYTLALAMRDAGLGAQARALLASRLDRAPEGDKPMWRLVQATYLDDEGDPGAAAALLALSAQMPADLHVQQVVLAADSVWQDPAPLDEVIARLRAITGDKAIQWRVYRNKRELALLDLAAPDLVQRANGIVLDMASVIKADPTDIEALLVSSQASTLAGDSTRAADTLLKAARAQPSNLAVRLALVDALKLAGRIEEARRNVRDLPDLPTGDHAFQLARAHTLEQFGFPELAARDWESLAGAGNLAATVRLAQSLLASGQPEKAEALIAGIEAQQSVPDDVLRDIAVFHAHEGRVEQGLASLARLPETGRLGEREAVIAEYLALTVEDSAGARALEQRVAGSRSGAVWASLAQAYLRIDQLDEARRVIAAGLKVEPGSPELATLDHMFAASNAGDPVAYLGLLRSQLRFSASPEAEAAGAAIDSRLAGQSDNDALIARLGEIAARSPTSVEAWQALAVAYRAAERVEDVRATLLRAMELMSSNAAIARFATSLLTDLEMPEDALIAARNWRDRLATPEYAADQTVAALLTLRGQGAEAVNILRPWRKDIIANRDRYPNDAYLFARALAQSGDVQEAETIAGPFLKAEGQPARLYVAIAEVIVEPDSRKAWLQRTTPEIETRGDAFLRAQIAGAWLALARLSGAESDARESIRLADAALQLPDTDHVDLLVTTAGAAEVLADWDRAMSAYRTLLELRPTSPDIHNNLANAILQSKGDATDAEAHARKAVELARAAGLPPLRARSYLDTQAQALLSLARPAEAAEIYQTALQTDARWDYGLVGLAEALVAASRSDEAEAVLEKLDGAQLSDDLASRVNAVRLSLGK